MSLNELLKKIFIEAGLEAEQDIYEGSKDKYIVFTYELEQETLFADNKGQAEKVSLQIQLITPKEFNYFELKNKIKRALRKEGFYVEVGPSFLGDKYTGTEKIRQTVFEVEYVMKN